MENRHIAKFRTQLEINPPFVQTEEDSRLALQLYNKLLHVLRDALPDENFQLCDPPEMTVSNRNFIYIGITGFQSVDLSKLCAHMNSNFGREGEDWNFTFGPQIKSASTYEGEFRLRRLARAKRPIRHMIKDIAFGTLLVGNFVAIGLYLAWPRIEALF